jgi:hypothetical protein
MKRNVARRHQGQGEFHIRIIWTLPPELTRYPRSISGEDVQVEMPVSESSGAQTRSEQKTALPHESSGDPGTDSEDSIGDS